MEWGESLVKLLRDGRWKTKIAVFRAEFQLAPAPRSTRGTTRSTIRYTIAKVIDEKYQTVDYRSL